MIINNPIFYLGSIDETENETIDYDFSSLSTNPYQTAKQAVTTQIESDAGESLENLSAIEIAEYGIFGLLNYFGNHLYQFTADEIKTLIQTNHAQSEIANSEIAQSIYDKLKQTNYVWIKDQTGIH